MTIAESFVEYLQDNGVGTPGQNIFIGETPPSTKSPDSIWWVIESGGQKLIKAFTGESIKQYSLLVYRRGRNYGEVSNALFNLEELISCSGCLELSGFETIEVEVVQFPIDRDLDSEDRKIGLLQVNVKTYKSCNVS